MRTSEACVDGPLGHATACAFQTLNFTQPEFGRLGAMPVRRARSAPHGCVDILPHESGSRALSHAQTLLAQLKLPGHTPQASTAPLQNLSAKLVKARHCLHAVNLQVETIRNECDKARREVEASDTEISGMEHEEERLKLQYVESAPAGHYERVSCHSRRAARAWKPPARCARSTAGEPSAVGPRSPTGRLTSHTWHSPLTSNSLTSARRQAHLREAARE